jgi:hypothetical protein
MEVELCTLAEKTVAGELIAARGFSAIQVRLSRAQQIYNSGCGVVTCTCMEPGL